MKIIVSILFALVHCGTAQQQNFVLGTPMSAANVIQCPSGYTLLKDETICFGTFWDQFNSDPSVPRPTSASNTKCYYNWLPEEGCMIHSGRSAHYQICPSGYGHVVSYNQQQPVCTKVKPPVAAKDSESEVAKMKSENDRLKQANESLRKALKALTN